MRNLTVWTLQIEPDSRPYHFSSREEAILALRVHAAALAQADAAGVWALTPMPVDMLIADADARDDAEPEHWYVKNGTAVRVRRVCADPNGHIPGPKPLPEYMCLPKWVRWEDDSE